MVNFLFCSFVIKGNSVSSEMLEVPYGERNIIISLSSSCTHVLTELLKTQGLCSHLPNQGKSSWEYSPETCSQKFRLRLPWTAPHTCTPCLGTLRTHSQTEGTWFSQPHVATRTSVKSFHSTDNEIEWLVQNPLAGYGGSGTKNPGSLESSIILCSVQCSLLCIKNPKQIK